MTVEKGLGEASGDADGIDDAESAARTPVEMTLLIVDDDRPFLNRLGSAM